MKFGTLSLLALPMAVLGAGNAIVKNNCAKPIYLSSVGGSMGEEQKIAPGDAYSETLHRDPVSGGIAIKITTNEGGLYDGSPQMNFAYSLSGGRVWYDLSDVFGDPFKGNPVRVTADGGNCPGICWADGVMPGGSQVRDCKADADIVLSVCAAGC